jgi:hypothetical protein
MNPLPHTLLAAALTCCLAAPALADGPSVSIRAGANELVIAVDGDRAAEAVTPVDADESAFFEPDPFVPDVHPSREDAARALGTKWATLAAGRWERKPDRVRIMCPDEAVFFPLQESIRARLRDVPVERCDGTLCQSENAPPGEAWLYAEVTEAKPDRTTRRVNGSRSSDRNNNTTGGPGGSVSVRSTGASDAAAITKFVDKPWVADFARFGAQNRGRWVVARSDPDRPATSPLDAMKSARSAAAREVLPLVLSRLPRAGRYDHGAVLRSIENRLLGDRLVADRFPQKYERPYGSLYRESVLLDASDARLDPLAREIRGSLESQREARVNAFAAAGAILLVTYALYRLANAFTKGYFTWSLRTAAAVVAAGAVTVIVALA